MDLSQLSDAELAGLIQQRLNAPAPPTPQQVSANPAAYASAADRAMADPTKDMSGFERGRAAFGKAFSDAGLGMQQLLGKIAPAGSPADIDAKAAQAKIDASRKTDAQLMETTGGKVGTVLGNAALMVPTAAIPGVNTIRGAALANGLVGLAQPTTTEEGDSQRLLNGGISTLAGGAGQLAGKAIGRVVSPIVSKLTGEEARLAQVAASEGIPLDAAAQTGSKPLKIVNSVLDNLPFTAGPQAERAATTQAAFNAAALKRAGIDADKATPDILGQQKKDLGATFEDIAGRNSIDANQGQFLTKLGTIQDEANRRLSHPGPIANTVDDILDDVTKNGTIPGAKYQGWRETLRTMAQGTDTQAMLAGRLKRALDDAFSDSISGADSAAWKDASRKYANLKTILNAQGGAGNAAMVGDIAPAQLARALTASVGKEGKALGRGDLNDLSRIGNLFVRDNVPNSGTAQRLLAQGLLTGGGAGIGAGSAAATGHDPLTGAAYGAAGIGASMALPRIAQALINSRPGQAYLGPAVHMTPERRAALAQALRIGALSLAR